MAYKNEQKPHPFSSIIHNKNMKMRQIMYVIIQLISIDFNWIEL